MGPGTNVYGQSGFDKHDAHTRAQQGDAHVPLRAPRQHLYTLNAIVARKGDI